MPHFIKVAYIAAMAAVVGLALLMLLQRLVLRLLLSYKGFLFQTPGTKSKLVMLWGVSKDPPCTTHFPSLIPHLVRCRRA